VALSDAGTIVTWGSSAMADYEKGIGWLKAMKPSGYTAIRVGHTSFCALYTGDGVEGAIHCFGTTPGHYSGPIADSEEPLGGGWVSIYSNRYAYVGLKADGTAQAFGTVDYGGNIPSKADNKATDVARIVSNSGGFVAVLTDGSLLCWGDASNSASALCPLGS
jgi:hypothetical protein